MLLDWPKVGQALREPTRRIARGCQFTRGHLWYRLRLRYWGIVDRGIQVLNLGDANLPVDGGAFGDGDQ
jgi:hypothetical protein